MTKKNNFLPKFLERLQNNNIVLQTINEHQFIIVEKYFWEKCSAIFQDLKCRFVALWANDNLSEIMVTAAFEHGGLYYFLRTNLKPDDLQLASLTPLFPGANRLERHTKDMFGIEFTNHPDKRRWIRHQAWHEDEYPLRKNFIASQFSENNEKKITPADSEYQFQKAHGTGIFEIPVGPVHAGIIEPGHFRFQVAGEDVINLEEHLGYVHKGIEKIAEGRNIDGLLRLANRISGDSALSYSWATAKAIENIATTEVPERALFLRAVMSERERIANHLWDIAAVCNDVGFSFAYFQLGRLRELFVRNNYTYFGHRLLMDCICFGGVNHDLSTTQIIEMHKELSELKKELTEIYPILEDNSSLHDRIKTTGILSFETAMKLGITGFAGRASGIKFDLRVDAPYPPYNQLKINVPVFSAGDVLARIKVRGNEILSSITLLEELLTKLPNGSIKSSNTITPIIGEGIGLIEGWRGGIFVYVAFKENGLVDRFFPRDPSWFSWMALEQLIHGNIVPDFPVCNKSINGTYSGVDL